MKMTIFHVAKTLGAKYVDDLLTRLFNMTTTPLTSIHN